MPSSRPSRRPSPPPLDLPAPGPRQAAAVPEVPEPQLRHSLKDRRGAPRSAAAWSGEPGSRRRGASTVRHAALNAVRAAVRRPASSRATRPPSAGASCSHRVVEDAEVGAPDAARALRRRARASRRPTLRRVVRPARARLRPLRAPLHREPHAAVEQPRAPARVPAEKESGGSLFAAAGEPPPLGPSSSPPRSARLGLRATASSAGTAGPSPPPARATASAPSRAAAASRRPRAACSATRTRLVCAEDGAPPEIAARARRGGTAPST